MSCPSANNCSSVLRRVPVIVSDVDGVMKQGMSVISSTVVDAVKILRSPLSTIDQSRFPNLSPSDRLPFLVLTNRGGMTETEHAAVMNTAMGFEEDSPFAFTPDENILNYSALKEEFGKFAHQTILISGCQKEVVKIAKHCGAGQHITKAEYVAAYPILFPLSTVSHEETQEARQILQQRLNVSKMNAVILQCFSQITSFDEPLRCAAVFVMSMPYSWEEDIQLIIDLLSTEDGSFAQTMPLIGPSKHIPIYIAYNDLTYKDKFCLPRIVNGAFTECLKATYLAVYKRELTLEMYGKPEITQFHFAERVARGMLPVVEGRSTEISQFYMIGDNPHSDIRGANTAGWVSILVRTGTFQGKENDHKDPANYVVQDFHTAVKLIFQLEGISTSLFH